MGVSRAPSVSSAPNTVGSASGRVSHEEILRSRSALHRDAGREAEHVQPGRAGAGVRPVHQEHLLRRQEQVVGANIQVNEGVSFYGGGSALFQIRQPVQVARRPGIQITARRAAEPLPTADVLGELLPRGRQTNRAGSEVSGEARQ